MSANRMMRTPCTLLREEKTGVDEHGDAIYEPAEVETVCALQQQRRSETEDGGEISDTVWKLFLPYGTEIGIGDAIVVNGRRYELVGESWDAAEGSRSMWHVEASVERTSGTGEGAGS